MQKKLSESLSMDFAAIGLALTRFLAFVRYGGRNGSATEQYISFLQTESPQFSRQGTLHNIRLEFCIPMELLWLIKMCSSDICNRF
jgi:hypothetical protein